MPQLSPAKIQGDMQCDGVIATYLQRCQVMGVAKDERLFHNANERSGNK